MSNFQHQSGQNLGSQQIPPSQYVPLQTPLNNNNTYGGAGTGFQPILPVLHQQFQPSHLPLQMQQQQQLMLQSQLQQQAQMIWQQQQFLQWQQQMQLPSQQHQQIQTHQNVPSQRQLQSIPQTQPQPQPEKQPQQQQQQQQQQEQQQKQQKQQHRQRQQQLQQQQQQIQFPTQAQQQLQPQPHIQPQHLPQPQQQLQPQPHIQPQHLPQPQQQLQAQPHPQPQPQPQLQQQAHPQPQPQLQAHPQPQPQPQLQQKSCTAPHAPRVKPQPHHNSLIRRTSSSSSADIDVLDVMVECLYCGKRFATSNSVAVHRLICNKCEIDRLGGSSDNAEEFSLEKRFHLLRFLLGKIDKLRTASKSLENQNLHAQEQLFEELKNLEELFKAQLHIFKKLNKRNFDVSGKDQRKDVFRSGNTEVKQNQPAEMAEEEGAILIGDLPPPSLPISQPSTADSSTQLCITHSTRNPSPQSSIITDTSTASILKSINKDEDGKLHNSPTSAANNRLSSVISGTSIEKLKTIPAISSSKTATKTISITTSSPKSLVSSSVATPTTSTTVASLASMVKNRNTQPVPYGHSSPRTTGSLQTNAVALATTLSQTIAVPCATGSSATGVSQTNAVATAIGSSQRVSSSSELHSPASTSVSSQEPCQDKSSMLRSSSTLLRSSPKTSVNVHVDLTGGTSRLHLDAVSVKGVKENGGSSFGVIKKVCQPTRTNSNHTSGDDSILLKTPTCSIPTRSADSFPQIMPNSMTIPVSIGSLTITTSSNVHETQPTNSSVTTCSSPVVQQATSANTESNFQLPDIFAGFDDNAFKVFVDKATSKMLRSFQDHTNPTTTKENVNAKAGEDNPRKRKSSDLEPRNIPANASEQVGLSERSTNNGVLHKVRNVLHMLDQEKII